MVVLLILFLVYEVFLYFIDDVNFFVSVLFLLFWLFDSVGVRGVEGMLFWGVFDLL